MKKRWIALFLGMLLTVSLFSACSSDENPDDSSSPEGNGIVITPDGEASPEGNEDEQQSGGQSTSGEQQNNQSEQLESGEIVMDDPVVETEYGTLYYHEQWVGLMKIEQTKDGENLVIRFEGEADGTRYPLFTIIIGSSDEAYVGEITDASGTKREVFAIFENLEQYTEIAQEDYDRLCAMQEDINYVIENLK